MAESEDPKPPGDGEASDRPPQGSGGDAPPESSAGAPDSGASALWARIRGTKRPPALAGGGAPPPRPPIPPESDDPPRHNWTPHLIIWGGAAALCAAAFVATFFLYVTWDIPSTRDLWSATGNPSLTFLDRKGRVILREGARNAPPVDLAGLPPYVPKAFIAIEDRKFYKHFGIDLGGLTRAGFANMTAGHVVQGGSTITQQLAKNLFLNDERTLRRKAQEVALALWLENKFSKKDILALYLSRVYFGAGAWGIDAAAERYFDKPARELTLSEAALLAALLKAPSRLNPAAQDTAAKARAKIVLDEMLANKFISVQERNRALNAPLSISRKNPTDNLGYFRTWIDPQLSGIIGDQRDDFIIETSLDLDAQRAGEKAVADALTAEGAARGASQGALLSLDAEGGVRAMVGGRGFETSQFNRATQARRSPGSAFKYFIYLTAMARGYTPWMVRDDAALSIGDWSPGNYEDKFYGPVALSFAYAKSLNSVAIRLAAEVGGANVIAMARSLGVQSELHNYRSLALGAQGMTLLDLTRAYTAMAANGSPVEPYGILRVKRGNGQVVWARRTKPQDQLIDQHTQRMMNYIGERVVEAGTGRRALLPGRTVAGKTGTGNDYRDAWFIGYIPGLATGVWIGNDDFSPMKKITGGSLPAEIWHEFMTVAARDVRAAPLLLPRPEDIPPDPIAVVAAPAETLPGIALPSPAAAPAPKPVLHTIELPGTG